MAESIFNGKTLLITGGTGSFGNAVLKRFLDTDIKEIRIFSRDEKKQDDMRHAYNNDKIKYYIGDVRNLQSIKNAMYGVDYVFHAAALKQVPSCEFFPLEAVYTNVIGTDNVLTACKASVVVSYNDCEYVRDLYRDFYILAFSRPNSMSHKAGSQYREIIMTNFDPRAIIPQTNLFETAGQYGDMELVHMPERLLKQS